MEKIILTAATLRSILCFIDPTNTRKIAYDKDEYAEPLRNKIKESLYDRDGSQDVSITFTSDESELKRQFKGVCGNISSIYQQLK